MTVDPGTSPADANPTGDSSSAAHGAATRPTIISRAQWGADESLRTCDPTYSPTIKAGFVHHTDGSNTYSASESASLVRGIYAYHVKGNGWCDVGYNFLVDRYGQIFEGRAGGVDQPVLGAHTLAFNYNSFGVSAMGDFTSAATPQPMMDSIVRVMGWKLSLNGTNPQGQTTLTSAGGAGAKYAAGTAVTFNVISGHRDAYSTTCPGTVLYNQLGSIRASAARYIVDNTPRTVTLVGHGEGHGTGLGQYGAYGYAVDQGWTSGMILDHFYGGTRSGTIAPGSVSVALQALSSGTWVTSAGGFTIGDPGNPSAARQHIDGGSAARLVRSGSGWQVYTTYGGCGAPNNYGPYPVGGSSIWLDSDPGPSGGAAQLITTCANNTAYRGSLRAAWTGSASVMVNDVPMEQYLRSVVPAESPAAWADARDGRGVSALEAQAVAARSYAASESRWSWAKTCDTSACQVYAGAYRNGKPVEDGRTDRAVANTANVVRQLGDGSVAKTLFSSSTGGYTAGGGFTRVEDQGDSRSPSHTWTTQLQGSDLAAAYGVGNFTQLLVTQQNPGGAMGGRVLQVRVVGTLGSANVSGADFRSRWGLKSDWFFPVDQAIQEVTSTAFVKHAYDETVYRQFCLSWNAWCDHAPVSFAEWSAAGYPKPVSVATDYVKYPWSPAIYAVSFWPQETSWQWQQLTGSQWAKAGYPAPRTAGFIYGTMYYTVGSSPTVFANSPDGVNHPLTYAEWSAAGRPAPVRR